ncbi:hypothetical protein FSP39_010904 [Pinctada imbricata]|uniref:Tyr recombinase domain-containing protein n=1 Tax=Pinctada imbricata TaxID=66713 RepID=A0AA88YI64_PINIB|nr:hypothetical protein FSP39_010904 [Pinctada imbricata]
MAENTLATHNTGLTAFSNFRRNKGFDALWPPPVNHVIDFIASLSLRNYSFATARSYVAAISYYCKLHVQTDPTNKFVVSKLLEGMRRLNKTRDKRLPITATLPHDLMSNLTTVCYSAFEAAMFRVAFSVAFHAFLRIGELTNTKTTVSLHIDDVQMESHRVILRIAQSKTDQYGKGTKIMLNATCKSTYPVLSMKSYLQLRPNFPGAAFCHFDGRPLTRYQFSAVLKKVLAILGYPPNRYTSHSFRIGAATYAASIGLDDNTIKRAGRGSLTILDCSTHSKTPSAKTQSSHPQKETQKGQRTPTTHITETRNKITHIHANQRDQWATGADLGRLSDIYVADGVAIRITCAQPYHFSDYPEVSKNT